MSYIPDISHYHPVTDFSKLDVSFIISKATEGTSFVDSTLDDFITGCEKNKIPYWLYTYLNKGNEKAQAEFLVSTCKNKVGSYFRGYALDVESANSADNVQEALDYIKTTGKVLLYTGYKDYDLYENIIKNRPSDVAWWESRYGANDGTDTSSKYPCHTGVDLHQYTSKGSCAGIDGNCDLNKLTGTKTESWFTGAEKSVEKVASTTEKSAEKVTLDVDGSIGPKTVTRLQEVLGTTQDGVISGQSSSYKKYWASIASEACKWSGGSSKVVKAVQKMIGVTQDGSLGPTTSERLQTYLIGEGYSCGSTGADGYFGTNSAKGLQRWLNAQ